MPRERTSGQRNLHDFNSAPSIIKEDEMGGACSAHGRGEKDTILDGKPFGTHWIRWVDNIKLDFGKIWIEHIN
jgi:hypothetical protein